MLSSSSGPSARGTRGPAREPLRDSGGEGRALGASSAAAHGSEQPSWATGGPGEGAAAIWVPGELLPPHITLPDSSAPPSALAGWNPRGSGAPSFAGAFSSGEFSRVRWVVALSSPPGRAAVPSAAGQGSDHTPAGAPLASEPPQEGIGIAAPRLGSRAEVLRAGRSFAPARPGQLRPRRRGAHGRALWRGCPGGDPSNPGGVLPEVVRVGGGARGG